ncbi:MAG TPA: glycosyltransferase family 9 protein [Candidatus Eisenbacteria bacterium]|nr:glycosyltransferase family 9 protein [Candidatus Eisenbacteria bacterium]
MDLNLARYIDKWVGLVICLVLFAWERATRPWHGRAIRALSSTTPPGLGEPPIEPRRILCMKFYGLGNAVMLIPVLEAVRRRWPGVEIDFLTMPGNVALLERSGVVTAAYAVDTASLGRFLSTLWAAFLNVRARRYDTVLDFEQFVKISSIIAFLSGARERIGFNTDGQRRGFTYTRRVVYTDSDHMSAIFARLTRPLGVTGPLPECRLPLADAERAKARDFLAKAGVAPDHFPIVAIHLGIGMNFYRVALKRWDPANFAALADALAERHGAAVVFTGQGAEERDLIAEARRRMRRPAIDACDQFNVTELAALVDHCHFVVSNDTSVMHVAALMGTPVVAIFGPTAPLHYGPRGERNLVFYRDLYCSPCLTNYNLKVSRCLDNVCMRGITPDAVLEAITAQYLGERATHREWLAGRARDARAA